MTKSILAPFMGALLAFVGFSAAAIAQDATPSPAPAALPAGNPTSLDREFDGKTHLTLTPYVWLPTINGNFQYKVPVIPKVGGGGTANLNVQLAPNGYLSHLNFALMGAFDLRKGNADLFGDYIDLNLSSQSAFVKSISVPGVAVQIPIDLGTSNHVSSNIWELGAGFTLARGHNANVDMFAGWREAAVNGNLDWTLNIKNGLISKSGSISRKDTLTDAIFGFRGKALFGDGRLYVPYYVDIGSGDNNQTWQAYTGIGYATGHGSLLLAWRSLNYNSAPQSAYVQKLRLDGPLLGYSFSY